MRGIRIRKFDEGVEMRIRLKGNLPSLPAEVLEKVILSEKDDGDLIIAQGPHLVRLNASSLAGWQRDELVEKLLRMPHAE